MRHSFTLIVQPENLLLKTDDDAPVLKIADFGLSQLIGPDERLLKVCGTWAYAAPEMSDPTKPGYDCKFDCFSFGVILCK
jgi:serine/threonine protein kinase